MPFAVAGEGPKALEDSAASDEAAGLAAVLALACVEATAPVRPSLAHSAAVGGRRRPTSRLTVGLISDAPCSSGRTLQLK